MYMNGRLEYDHEYFQRMIEHEQKVNSETVNGIITDLREAVGSDYSSSKDGSMPGLQERAMAELSSDRDIDSFGKEGIYDNGETWGFKELSLKQVVGGKPSGMFPSNVPTLCAFSWHGYAQVCKNPPVEAKSDFYHAKEYIRFPTGLTTTKTQLWRIKRHRFSVCMMQDPLRGLDKKFNTSLL